jgi:hypothetical protein
VHTHTIYIKLEQRFSGVENQNLSLVFSNFFKFDFFWGRKGFFYKKTDFLYSLIKGFQGGESEFTSRLSKFFQVYFLAGKDLTKRKNRIQLF